MASTPQRQQRHRAWVWTLNNYCDEELGKIASLTENNDKIRYLGYGLEIGDSLTPHCQGVLSLMEGQTCKRVSKYEGLERAWLQPMRGSFDVARDYAKKDGIWAEWGTLPMTPKQKGQNEKNKWKNIINWAKAGEHEKIEAEYPNAYLRQYRTLKLIAKDNLKPPADLGAPVGVWIWGKPGVGKSFRARQEYPGAYLKMYNKWWDGYQGQESVIMDEMELEGAFMGHLLKVWCDEYAFITECKGSALVIRPKVFVITSNYSIDQVFQESEMNGAIHRRFREIEMKKRWEAPEPVECVPRAPGSEDDPIEIDSEDDEPVYENILKRCRRIDDTQSVASVMEEAQCSYATQGIDVLYE